MTRESDQEERSFGEAQSDGAHTKTAEQPNRTPRPEGLMTKRELAVYCGVTARCVDNWMSKGLIPYFKINRTVRFRLSNVEAHFDTYCRVLRRRTKA